MPNMSVGRCSAQPVVGATGLWKSTCRKPIERVKRQKALQLLLTLPPLDLFVENCMVKSSVRVLESRKVVENIARSKRGHKGFKIGKAMHCLDDDLGRNMARKIKMRWKDLLGCKTTKVLCKMGNNEAFHGMRHWKR